MYRYRRQIRLLLLLLFVAAAAYGGIKGWMYLNAKRAMEELSVATAGRAEIRYQGIETDLTGSVAIRDVELQVAGAPSPLRVASVRVSGPPLTFFLLGQKKDDPPPPRMFVDVEGLEIDLDQALFDSLQQQLGAAAARGQGCGAGEDLDPALLRELGFERLRLNAGMAYQYDQARRAFDGRLDVDVAQIERVHASIALADVAPDALQGEMAGIPSLAGMAVEVRVEPEFGRRYLAACAKRRNQTLEAYRARLVNETLAEMARAGLHLGPGLIAALTDFHRDWGEFRISAEPAEPVNPMSLMFRPPEDWQKALGIRARLNRREIADLSFELRPPDPGEMAALLGQEVETSAPRVKRPQYRYVYRPVAVSTLGDHLGVEARLHLRDGQPMRSGILTAFADGEVRVEQRLHGGKITAHVPLSDIVRAEVQQVERIPEANR